MSCYLNFFIINDDIKINYLIKLPKCPHGWVASSLYSVLGVTLVFQFSYAQKKKVLLFIGCSTESLSHFYHSQMNGVENMDGEFEQTTLHMFIDCTFQPTFLHSDTPHTAFQNFEETITELAAVLTVLTSAVSTKTTFILINLCRICLFPL